MDRPRDYSLADYVRYDCRACNEPFIWRQHGSDPRCPNCEPASLTPSLPPSHQAINNNNNTPCHVPPQQHSPTQLHSFEWTGPASTKSTARDDNTSDTRPGCLAVIEPRYNQHVSDVYAAKPKPSPSQGQIPRLRDVRIFRQALEEGVPRPREHTPPPYHDNPTQQQQAYTNGHSHGLGGGGLDAIPRTRQAASHAPGGVLYPAGEYEPHISSSPQHHRARRPMLIDQAQAPIDDQPPPPPPPPPPPAPHTYTATLRRDRPLRPQVEQDYYHDEYYEQQIAV
ncbi:hypothetical protein F4777DRAFT_579386 [Nemania sp. FL0916]|nr:hypothetical protein F4777DRAFT_579386 [Nemania sp. FL0916]